jgi:predicted transcriptional regulator
MIARNLITDGILPLKTTDTGRNALEWMEDFKILHLPIVSEQHYLGLISEFDIYTFNKFDDPISSYELTFQKTFVYEDQHIYEVVKVLQLYRLSLIPVVDTDENYLGAITLQSLLEHFASTLSVVEPGGIIVLGINNHDYVLSEIARIIESNDAKILSLIVSSDLGKDRLEVTIKLNKRDISSVLKTFERFSYEVLASFGAEDDFDDLRQRYDSLMTYLKV